MLRRNIARVALAILLIATVAEAHPLDTLTWGYDKVKGRYCANCKTVYEQNHPNRVGSYPAATAKQTRPKLWKYNWAHSADVERTGVRSDAQYLPDFAQNPARWFDGNDGNPVAGWGHERLATTFTTAVYPAIPAEDNYFAGQEVRVRLSAVLGLTSVSQYSGGYQPVVIHVNNGTGQSNLTRGEGWLGLAKHGLKWFNTSSDEMAIRIIKAYDTSSLMVHCNSSDSYVWQEHHDLASRSYQWGNDLTTDGWATFTVPAYQWRICYRHYRPDFFKMSAITETWESPDDQDFVVHGWNTSTIFWKAATEDDHVTGDYAAVSIVPAGTDTSDGNFYGSSVTGSGSAQTNAWPFVQWTPAASTPVNGDAVKLVPKGYPCSYEKESIAWGTTKPLWTDIGSYPCFSNDLNAMGDFNHEACLTEGSVKNGVGLVGTDALHPIVDSSTLTTAAVLSKGYRQVAYFKLPAAGVYDVCYSPLEYRYSVWNTNSTDGDLTPVWFKAFDAASCSMGAAGATVTAGCTPTNHQMKIRSAANTAGSGHSVTWNTYDNSRLTWGTIKFTSGKSDLNTNRATYWDCNGCAKQYFSSMGGDQFRLVKVASFGAGDTETAGNMWKTDGTAYDMADAALTDRIDTGGYPFLGASVSRVAFASTKTKIHYTGLPSAGTYLKSTDHGCFDNSNDYYGETCSIPFSAGLTQCSGSDTNDLGPTASGDMGGNPHTASGNLLDQTAQQMAWAYIRIPKDGSWKVCHRFVSSSKSVTFNWRVISWSLPVSTPTLVKQKTNELNPAYGFADFTNFTFSMNDTRSQTWGELRVFDPTMTLTTEDSNYVGSSITDATTKGFAIKLVKHTENCWLSTAQNKTSSTMPGLPECDAAQLAAGGTGEACHGSLHTTTAAQSSISFYIKVPNEVSSGNYYRVCFRHKAANWQQLENPDAMMNNPYTSYAEMSPNRFVPLPEPIMTYTLSDTRARSWGKILIRSDRKNLNARPLQTTPSGLGGDVLRLVKYEFSGSDNDINQCDFTSKPSTANVWDATKTNWDLGAWCHSDFSHASSTAGDVCHTDTINPTDGAVQGTFPYTHVNAKSDDDDLMGVVAFLTLPMQAPEPSVSHNYGYKLCYKQRGGNWYNVPPEYLEITAESLYKYSQPPTGVLYAGEYSYLTITGDTSNTINLNGATASTGSHVKLVLDSAGGCDQAAAGTQSNGNKYIASTWATTRGGEFVADSATRVTADDAKVDATVGRAYFTFPSISGITDVSTNYKVCFIKVGGATHNWFQVGTAVSSAASSPSVPTPLPVKSLGLTYTVSAAPYTGATINVVVLSSGSKQLNTKPGKDSAKIVAALTPCFDNAVNTIVPVTFLNLGKHEGHELYTKTSVADLQTGHTDLGPTDEEVTLEASFVLSLKHTALQYYKVCYKPTGMPWMEVGQTLLDDQLYGLGEDGIKTIDSKVSEFEVSSKLTSPLTTNAAGTTVGLNHGILSGVSTYLNTDRGIKVLSTGTLTTGDHFKFVKTADEVVGTYVQIPHATCMSDAFPGSSANGVAVTSASYLEWDSTNQKIKVTVQAPTEAGQYIICYKRSHHQAWILLKPATSGIKDIHDGNNPAPFYVWDSMLGFKEELLGQLTIVDNYHKYPSPANSASGPVSYASLDVADQIYIINATDVCGDQAGNYRGDSGVVAQSLDQPSTGPKYASERYSSSYANGVLTPWWPILPTKYKSWYKVCYKKTDNTATIAGSDLPLANGDSTTGVWYQLKNRGELSDSSGANTHFYVVAEAKYLEYQCPAYNTTYKIRTGESFDVRVNVLDAAFNVMPFSKDTFAYAITAVGTDFTMSNTAGACRPHNAMSYGWKADNLVQWTQNGAANFRIAATSKCPSGGCKLSFSYKELTGRALPLSDASNPSAECTFDVFDTTVAAMQVQEPSSTPTVDLLQEFNVRAIALDADKKPAYTSEKSITVKYDTGKKGLKLTIAGQAVPTDGLALNLVSGAVSFKASVAIDSSTAKDWISDSTFPIQFYVGNVKMASVNVVVRRPTLTYLRVADIYAVNHLSKIVNDQKINMIPNWEPSTGDANGIWVPHDAVTGKSDKYLVAGQYYTVVLQSFDGQTPARLIPYNSLLQKAAGSYSKVSIKAITENKIITPQSGESDLDENRVNLLNTGKSLSDTNQKLTFRLQSSKGCRGTGCDLTFLIENSNPTGAASVLKTRVRSVATQLKVTCTGPSDGSGGTMCSGSHVSKGLEYTVDAVDQFGDIDEFNNGNIQALLQGGDGIKNDDGLILVKRGSLSSSDAGDSKSWENSRVPMLAGKAYFVSQSALTFNKPATHEVQFLSDWGANIAKTTMVIKKNIHKLMCTMVALRAKEIADTVISDPSTMILNAVVQPPADAGLAALIYKDTQVCVTVYTADSDDAGTEYGTHWVMGWVVSKDGSTSPAADMPKITTSATRMQALMTGKRTFCFNIAHSNENKKSMQFSIKFAAQRWNEWHGNNLGTCEVGNFEIEPKKIIKSVVVNSVTGIDGEVQKTRKDWRYGRLDKIDGSLTVVAKFDCLDHYGNIIAPKDMDTTDATFLLLVNNCKVESGEVMCDKSTGLTTEKIIHVGTSGKSHAEAGLLYVSLTSHQKQVGQTDLSYSFQVEKYCLYCTLGFTVYKQDGTAIDVTRSISTGSVYLTVLPPADLTKAVAFQYGASPLNPLQNDFTPQAGSVADTNLDWATSHWKHYYCSSAKNPATGIIMFQSGVHTTCAPDEKLFMKSHCDDQSATTLLSDTIDGPPSPNAANGQVRLYVVATESVGDLRFSAPYCAGGACTGSLNNVKMLVDFENGYNIGISAGTQRLANSGSQYTTTGDHTTKLSQGISTSGTTLGDKIYHLMSHQYSTTGFKFKGIDASNYYARTSDNKVPTNDTASPSMKHKFSASAVANSTDGAITVTSLSTSSTGASRNAFEFVWRGPQSARFFTVQAAAMDSKCPALMTFWNGLDSNGYQQHGLMNAFQYASKPIPVAETFPITVDVQDKGMMKVASAAGKVTIYLDSWHGCNNGGAMTVTGGAEGSLSNGRVTFLVSFSAPCEKCVFKFKLVPDTNQEATLYCLSTGSSCTPFLETEKIAYSNAFSVKQWSDITDKTQAVMTTHDKSTQSGSLTVADSITVPVETVWFHHGVGYFKNTVGSGTVQVFNKIVSRTAEYWYGNGGVLRLDTNIASRDRNGVSASIKNGKASVTFGFTRTCKMCSVVVRATTSDGSMHYIKLQNMGGSNFVVSTTAARRQLVGYQPRRAAKGELFGAALHHVGDDFGIKSVGRSSNMLSQSKPSGSATNSLNGRGGDLYASGVSLSGTASEVWRLAFPEVCAECTVAFGSEKFPLLITTKATRLVINSVKPDATDASYMQHWAAPASQFTFQVYAADEDGYNDVTVGGPTSCKNWEPFKCQSTTKSNLKLSLGYKAQQGGGWPVQFDRTWFTIAGKTTRETPELGSNFALRDGQQLGVDGENGITARFAEPVRQGWLIFSTGALSSATSKMNTAMPAAISVKVPDSDLILAVAEADPTIDNKVITAGGTEDLAYIGVAKTFTVAFTRQLTDPDPKYVAASVHDVPIKVSFDNCGSTPEIEVMKGEEPTTTMYTFLGLAKFNIMFKEQTAEANPCQVKFTTSHPKAKINQAIAKIKVAQILPDKWSWVAPSTMVNGGEGVGPMYGVAERKTELKIALQDSQGRSAKCGTNCKLTVTHTDQCVNIPTLSDSAGVKFDETSGIATTSITWKKGTANEQGNYDSYKCQIQVTVDYSGQSLSPSDGNSASPEVTVFHLGSLNSKDTTLTTKLSMVTNVTTDYPAYLETGKPYHFHVAIENLNGAHVKGDTGVDATALTVDVVNEKDTGAPTFVKLVNVNKTAPYEKDDDGKDMKIGNTVKSVYGGYSFALVFSNATDMGAGVRIRIKAVSQTPAWEATMISEPVSTMLKAAQLRVSPDTALPEAWITDRSINTSDWATDKVTVQSVDAIKNDWVKFFSSGANVVKRQTDADGNELPGIECAWLVDPLPLGKKFPLTANPSKATLQEGEAQFNLRWTGPDGMFKLKVYDTNSMSHIKDFISEPILFQRAASLRMDTTDFRPETISQKGSCDGNCYLPNTTFHLVKNGSQTFMDHNATSTSFNLTAFFADSNGKVVEAEDYSYIQAELVPEDKTVTTTVALIFEGDDNGNGAGIKRASVKTEDGRARFTAFFAGSTAVNNDPKNHSAVKIVFSCDPKRAYNPCEDFGVQPVKTMPIRVLGLGMTRAERAKLPNPVVQFVSTLTNLNDFSIAAFKTFLKGHFSSNGYNYITAAAMQTVACEVNAGTGPKRFATGNQDLGQASCHGENKCDASSPADGTTPLCENRGILWCRCDNVPAPTTTSTGVFRRLLQDNSTVNVTTAPVTNPPVTPSPKEKKVVIELTINIEEVVGWPETDTDKSLALIDQLAETMRASSSVEGFNDPDIGIVTAGTVRDEKNQQIDPPTPPPTDPIVAPTPPPVPATPPPTEGAGTTTFSMLVLIAAAMAALFIA